MNDHDYSEFMCPRCRGFMPTNENPGAYVGALSRAGDVYICSACGTDEALGQFTHGVLIPVDQWPITTPTTIPENVEKP